MLGVGYSLMRLLSARLAIAPVEGDSAECSADQVPISNIVDISPSQVSEEKGSCLLMLFRGNLLISVSCVIVLSILIEGAQALLPASFSRGYAWGGSLGFPDWRLSWLAHRNGTIPRCSSDETYQ